MSEMEMVACVAVQRVNDAMPGEETAVPAEAYRRLLAQGVIRPRGEVELPPQTPPAEYDRPLTELIAEIPEDEEFWTAGGKPTTEAFETLFERKVTAQERDEAWEAYDSGESA